MFYFVWRHAKTMFENIFILCLKTYLHHCGRYVSPNVSRYFHTKFDCIFSLYSKNHIFAKFYAPMHKFCACSVPSLMPRNMLCHAWPKRLKRNLILVPNHCQTLVLHQRLKIVPKPFCLYSFFMPLKLFYNKTSVSNSNKTSNFE